MSHIAVLGSGSWGVVLASLAANMAHRVTLWGRNEDVVAALQQHRVHPHVMTGVELPPGVSVTASLGDALAQADFILIAVPSDAVRSLGQRIEPLLKRVCTIVSCSKGLDPTMKLRLSQVLQQVLGAKASRLAVLSGPNLAAEIALGHPAAAVIASDNLDVARSVQSALSSGRFRLYTSTDVAGVEFSGALKNCVAIAAGISDGLDLGINSRSALITRGLTEIVRLGTAGGAEPLTFLGLAGLGDLIATCSSTQSRNHQVGVALAQGLSVQSAVTGLGHVAEGVETTRVAYLLARDLNVRTPIIDGTYDVLFRGRPVREALIRLLSSEPGEEFD
ncbi:MAG: NAD(P)-dependent glycerol-3-phosphate dehydrogenase [Chloroflexi bacterium]|nr:NAD(P)-dependent glycerol-3-phosphate dehydrogenase [Chloroflexota bacterium]